MSMWSTWASLWPLLLIITLLSSLLVPGSLLAYWKPLVSPRFLATRGLLGVTTSVSLLAVFKNYPSA